MPPLRRRRGAEPASRGPAVVVAGAVIALVLVRAYREISSHPPFSAPV